MQCRRWCLRKPFQSLEWIMCSACICVWKWENKTFWGPTFWERFLYWPQAALVGSCWALGSGWHFWILESSPPELKLQNCSACTFLFFGPQGTWLSPTALPMFPKVDLLLIHFPCVDQQDFPNACGSKGRKERLDTWHGITQLRKNGKVRAIGAFWLQTGCLTVWPLQHGWCKFRTVALR